MSIVGILGAAEGLIGLFRSGIELIPNENERRRLQAELETQQVQFISAINQSQIEINQIDAASQSRFQSWWRPACGWVCVAGVGIQFLLYPLLGAVMSVVQPGFSLPSLDLSEAITLLLGLLGMAGLRAYDKARLGGGELRR